jgi:hypothetical protein
VPLPSPESAASPFEPSPPAEPLNPFSDITSPFAPISPADSNPYQSPLAASATSFMPTSLSREIIESRVRGPAIALTVLSVLMLSLLGLGCIGQVVVSVTEGVAGVELAANLGTLAVSAVINAVMLLGSLKMRRLENYALSVTASVLAALPCFSCCLLGLPIGIWSLVVLMDQQVRSAFR